MKNFIWKFLPFNELSNNQLYSVLALREEVFEIEQNCIYQDLDFQDQMAIHILCLDSSKESNDGLAAYCRVFTTNAERSEAVIGRVIVNKNYRSQKLGYELMNKVIEFLKSKGEAKIKIAAQAHLKRFYENLGFVWISDDYDLDGIPHLDMRLVV
ncbi:MAG: GNAT family N-acetyltransferase [Candidatus Caenarcaniphilales bacterium]|nr:GNAT family N-acetyltransferase [Candidatus Caenarcaniphilales bacterium]